MDVVNGAAIAVFAEDWPAYQEVGVMESFVHRQNIEHYRKLLAETTDEVQRRLLLKLLAEEEAKDLSASPNGGPKSPPENP
jgi:hypothetical protein